MPQRLWRWSFPRPGDPGNQFDFLQQFRATRQFFDEHEAQIHRCRCQALFNSSPRTPLDPWQNEMVAVSCVRHGSMQGIHDLPGRDRTHDCRLLQSGKEINFVPSRRSPTRSAMRSALGTPEHATGNNALPPPFRQPEVHTSHAVACSQPVSLARCMLLCARDPIAVALQSDPMRALPDCEGVSAQSQHSPMSAFAHHAVAHDSSSAHRMCSAVWRSDPKPARDGGGRMGSTTDLLASTLRRPIRVSQEVPGPSPTTPSKSSVGGEARLSVATTIPSRRIRRGRASLLVQASRCVSDYCGYLALPGGRRGSATVQLERPSFQWLLSPRRAVDSRPLRYPCCSRSGALRNYDFQVPATHSWACRISRAWSPIPSPPVAVAEHRVSTST